MDAVRDVLAKVARCVDEIALAIRDGGRLHAFGAGTSGRLAVLDASECPPTFGTPPDLIQGHIAGGPRALTDAIEGAEDDEADGAAEVHAFGHHVPGRGARGDGERPDAVVSRRAPPSQRDRRPDLRDRVRPQHRGT